MDIRFNGQKKMVITKRDFYHIIFPILISLVDPIQKYFFDVTTEVIINASATTAVSGVTISAGLFQGYIKWSCYLTFFHLITCLLFAWNFIKINVVAYVYENATYWTGSVFPFIFIVMAVYALSLQSEFQTSKPKTDQKEPKQVENLEENSSDESKKRTGKCIIILARILHLIFMLTFVYFCFQLFSIDLLSFNTLNVFIILGLIGFSGSILSEESSIDNNYNNYDYYFQKFL